MRPLHQRFLVEIAAERRRLSRRGLLAGSAKLAGGGALALSLAGVPVVGRAQDATTAAEELQFESDVDVLNFALTLEHLENAFYRDGLPLFPDLGTDGFGFSVLEQVSAIGAHEAAHVVTLTDVITSLGGTPVEEATYDFEDAYADDTSFLMTAMALENTGVQAYNGAGQFLTDPGLLTAAGSIVSVEARHASYLNLINDEDPFPAAFDEALTPAEVLDAAGPFLAS